MKTIFFHLFLCVVLLGCEEDDANTSNCPIKFSSSTSQLLAPGSLTPAYPCDYIKARKNLEMWTVHAITSFGFQNDTLYVNGSGNEESLVFKFHFKGLGTYDIATKASDGYFNGNAYYYTTIGLDVITSMYILVQKSTVEIVEYNETEKTIKGNFKFYFKELSGSATLRMEQGMFSVHLPV